MLVQSGDIIHDLWDLESMSLSHRPRFDFVIPMEPEEAVSRLRRAFAATDLPLRGAHFPSQCEIQVNDDVRHVWSPHMSVILEVREDGTHVTGQVGPNMPVWSLFITAYGILSVVAVASLMFGYSQWSIGQTPIGFMVATLCTVLPGVVYATGKLGERLAAPQTLTMHEFLRQTLAVDG